MLQITGAESGFPEQMLDRVQKVAGVEYAVPVIETNANLAQGTNGRSRSSVSTCFRTITSGITVCATRARKFPIPLLFLARPDSILLTREMAGREGLKIDQKIRVQTVQGIKTFTVRGLLDPDGPAKAVGGDIAVHGSLRSADGLRKGRER